MNNQENLYRGEWISESELEQRIDQLENIFKEDLGLSLEPEILMCAAARLRDKILGGDNHSLIRSLVEAGTPEAQAKETLDVVAAFLHREYLTKKYIRELGSVLPFQMRRINFREPVFEAWAPLGILVHVVPGNAPTVAPLSVLEGLMAGNINVLKNSSKNGNFTQLLLKELADADTTGILKNFIYAFKISSHQAGLLQKLFNLANGIAAWGGEESVASVKKMTPPAVKIIDWGHKISFSYVAKSHKKDRPSLEKIAYDICIIEQQACSSPQCLYFETEDRQELESFAEYFAEVLNDVSVGIIAKQPSMHEMAEITTISHLARTGAVLGESDVIEADDKSWRVLVDYKSGLRPSPLYRTIWVKPMPRKKIIATLEPLRTYLQTAGVAGNLDDLAEISSLMIRAGVTRIMRPGHMLDDFPGQPHDGVYALPRYSRRVSLQADDVTNGVADFGDFEEQKPIPLSEGTPIMTKEDFLNMKVAAENAELFFKSGGSTGNPKTAVYTYHDYHLQMKVSAEALFAAGLDPITDRCANLFLSGSMYGGFISFWTILENMEAVQYPITAISDLEEVGQLVVNNNINTLLGMPFYLSQLIEHNYELFKTYRGIRKIFTGGEHWTKAQRQKIQDDLGIDLIKSAIYGSNDAGPMGFSCKHCGDGEFHLMSQTQYLEILKMELDEPVEENETGRMFFTSKFRKGQNLNRYEIGDMGRWINKPCACGRKIPKFELLGRYGDIFKIGPLFNYREVVKAIQDGVGYTGNVQMVISMTAEGKHLITLRISNTFHSTEEGICDSVIRNYHALGDMIESRDLIKLRVEFINEDEFEKTASSGKLKPIIDIR